MARYEINCEFCKKPIIVKDKKGRFCSSNCTKKAQRKRFRDAFGFNSTDIPSLDGEIWLDIVGFEGYYQISNLGRVKSINRIVNRSDGRREYRKNMLLKQKVRKSKGGYLEIQLQKDGFSRHIQIHRLVAIAFHPNPENKPQVNHKDFNVKNNCADNLEWATNLENTKHRFDNGRINKYTKDGFTVTR